MFAQMANEGGFEDSSQVPFYIVLPAYIGVFKLKTAFQIGFLLFLPFLVIDMVASVLLPLGMMMLSPMLIALPFKLLLFVLVMVDYDCGSLVGTFS